jgi:hypothetical protein
MTYALVCACCGAELWELVRVERSYCSPGCRESVEDGE